MIVQTVVQYLAVDINDFLPAGPNFEPFGPLAPIFRAFMSLLGGLIAIVGLIFVLVGVAQMVFSGGAHSNSERYAQGLSRLRMGGVGVIAGLFLFVLLGVGLSVLVGVFSAT